MALFDALIEGGMLTGSGTGTSAVYEVTGDGADVLAGFGIDVAEVRRSRRRFAGACLDWTQRQPHLNGALGAAVTARLLEARLDRARARPGAPSASRDRAGTGSPRRSAGRPRTEPARPRD